MATILNIVATIQARVFECASEIIGGQGQLCQRLGVQRQELSRWLADQETSPLPAFFCAVDIILASEKGFAAIFAKTTRAASLH